MMRIGELAKKAEVSRDTIRFYERHGLIHSDVDAAAGNGYRIYPEDAVLTLEVIKDAQAAGLSIADITLIMGQLAAQTAEDFDAQAFLDRKIEEVNARMQAARRFLDLLERTKHALAHAPQDGLDALKEAGAGNGNRTRN
ncbi:MerR family transcriptional regulator [Sulfitobacter sp. JB4-11]|uniref:MerR family transcriptional regulator n=1 Tax=Sulfitobacter rhodophyticola TaxID=3238304 RepID=UPI003512E1BB